MRTPPSRLLAFLVASVPFLLMACGSAQGPTEDELRSEREFELAAALQKEGNLPGAVQHLRKSIELDETNSSAHLVLGYIYYLRGDLGVAEKEMRRGVTLLEGASEESPELAEARNLLGAVLIDVGKYDEATQILRLSASDIMNRTPHLALGNLGLAHMKNGNDSAAEMALRSAVKRQPRFCVGFLRLGDLYRKSGKHTAAEESYTKAIEADPSCTHAPPLQHAWRMRGELRASRDDSDAAIEDLRTCVRIAPDSPDGKACADFLRGAGVALEPTGPNHGGRDDGWQE